MKDFLNFDIKSYPDGQRVRHIMQHKRRDACSVEFTTPVSTNAKDIPDLIKSLFKAWAHKYAAKTRKNLSPKQRDFYDKTVAFFKSEGRPPTYDEMCGMLGCSSKGTAHYFTHKLIGLGWLWVDEDGRITPIDIAAPDLTE